MYAWEAIQKSLDYIEDNLAEDLEIQVLASIASLSPYYFQRLFRRLLKKSVFEYVKLRRLAKASEMIKNSEGRLVDVALECGFSDHPAFSRALCTLYPMGGILLHLLL